MRSAGHPRAWDPEVIDQAIPHLADTTGGRGGGYGGVPPVVLRPEALKVWQGEKPVLTDVGRVDRSRSLVNIGRVVYDAGGERPLIVQALRERDEALGWRKYSDRPDGEQRYHEIVDELERNGRNRRVQATVGGGRTFNLTDLGNAERFVAQHGGNVRYCWPWNKWLVFGGKRWIPDDFGAVLQLAKQTVRGMYGEAAAANDSDRRKALAQHAMRSEAQGKIFAMLELAKSELPVMPDELDGNPYLLNCENGTLDLRSCELREHCREDYITKLVPVSYDPGAWAPLWEATLERVLPSHELREFFKRLCGYALTGDTSEHVLPILYGTGANGKSTVLNALLAVVGDYGMQAAPDLLIAKKGSHPTELADLFGMRLVASIEVEEGRRLAESLVKQLTGGDRVKARRMRQDFWEFESTHTVFMAVNHKPEVRGVDNAIWRRLRLIPFIETIPPAEQDKKLPEKLRGEHPGILTWAVQGCREWQGEGLQAPDEVRKATGEYRSEMDVIGAFLKDCCETGSGLRVGVTELYKEYEQWCEAGGERSETRRKFNARLKERGRFTDRRSGPNGSTEWRGLQLLKKQNTPFAGKLKQVPENDHKQLEKDGSRGNRPNDFSSSVTSVEFSVEDVLRELHKPDSGPAKTLAAYRGVPSDQRLEYLTKAVLVAKGMDTAEWQRFRDVVEEAAARLEGGHDA